MNSLLEATWRILPRDVRRAWKGNTSVDGTLYPLPSRKTRKESIRVEIEPDAGYWGRTDDHAPDPNASPSQRAKYGFGLDAHLAVTVANDPTEDCADFPIVALGMTTGRPGVEVAENTVALYKSMRDRGHPAGLLVADRAYFAGQDVDKFHLPLRALGYQPVTDYRYDQLGKRKSAVQGALVVEGQFVCPDVERQRPGLLNATRDFRDSEKSDENLRRWVARRKEIQRFAAKPHGRPNEDGFQRFTHPRRKDGKPVCDPNRPHAPTFCKQGSITVGPVDAAKVRQPLAYGSPEWLAMYGHGRNAIEGFNAYLKDESRQAFGSPSRRRVRGIAAQSLVAAALVVAANVRKIRTFLQNRAASAAKPKRRARRRAPETVLSFWHPSGPVTTRARPEPPLTT